MELKAGEALFFPPGFIHETLNVGDTCSSSVTYQFTDPAPTLYWRHFMTRVRRTGDLSECWKGIERLATLGKRLPLPGDNAYEQGLAHAIELDLNNDGLIGEEELQRAVQGHWLEALSFHDPDGNMELTITEFAKDYLKYAAIKGRVATERPIEGGRSRAAEDEDDDADDDDLSDDL